jgi:hypothetical protein
MGRVALLFGGELRNFSECYNSWITSLDGNDVDVFLSTWDKSREFSDRITEKQNNNGTFEVTKELVNDIVGDRLKYLNIETPINFEHRGNNQIYHWHRLLTVLINYKNDYEWAIIVRPDAVVSPSLNLSRFILKLTDKNNIYAPGALVTTPPPIPFTVTIPDWCFMASPDKLINVLLTLPYMKILDMETISKQLGDNMHTHLAHHFVENRCYVFGGLAGIYINSHRLGTV